MIRQIACTRFRLTAGSASDALSKVT
jgi:hypothetical protein